MTRQEIYLIAYLSYLGKYAIFSFIIVLDKQNIRIKKCINNIDWEMF